MKTGPYLLLVSTLGATPPLQAASAGHISAGLTHVQMTEYSDTGTPVIAESGWLPGVEAGVLRPLGRFDVFAAATLYGGDLDYDGRTQGGHALRSRTDTRLAQFRLGGQWHIAQGTTIGAELEADRWGRDIRSTAASLGLQERTCSLRLALEGAHLWTTGFGEWTAGAAIYRARAEKLSVSFPGTSLDTVTFRTHGATGYRVAFAWRPGRSHSIETTLRLDRIRIAASEAAPLTSSGVALGTIRQPSHRRQHATITAGYRF